MKRASRYWYEALRDFKRAKGDHDRMAWHAIAALDPNNGSL